MTPRPHASLAGLNEAASHRLLGIFVIIALAGLLSWIISKHTNTPQTADGGEERLGSACMQWHLAASAAVSRLVHSTRDADLRQVNDWVFRMRRARRNCEAGWFGLACQDYSAVAAGTPRDVLRQLPFRCLQVTDSLDDGPEVT